MTLNLAAGITSAIVVGIFAIAKFTEGAWVVVIVFPTLVYVLIRLNREYREEAAELRELGDAEADAEAVYSHHIVIVMVDAFDLATIEHCATGAACGPANYEPCTSSSTTPTPRTSNASGRPAISKCRSN